jgi:hypothetical protein
MTDKIWGFLVSKFPGATGVTLKFSKIEKATVAAQPLTLSLTSPAGVDVVNVQAYQTEGTVSPVLKLEGLIRIRTRLVNLMNLTVIHISPRRTTPGF